MKFPLLESLNAISNEIDGIAKEVTYSMAHIKESVQLVESADGVLGTLAAKLKSGNLQGGDYSEYAQLYAALSLLAQEDVRQAYNIDISTPAGKQKFASIVNGTGENQSVTTQVKRVAAVNGQSHYKQILSDLQNFQSLDPQKQQQYINTINKLRLGYERAKNTMQNAAPVPKTSTIGAPQPTSSASGTTFADNSSQPGGVQAAPQSTIAA